MIKSGSERGVNLGPPEKSSDCPDSDRKLSSGAHYYSLPIPLILVPTSEQSPLNSLTTEQKTDADRPPSVAD